jgi:hypothetical protein
MRHMRIRRVSVWLDSMAPDRGALAHDLDWAGHLEVPLGVFLAVPDVRPAVTLAPLTDPDQPVRGTCPARPHPPEGRASTQASRGLPADDAVEQDGKDERRQADVQPVLLPGEPDD